MDGDCTKCANNPLRSLDHGCTPRSIPYRYPNIELVADKQNVHVKRMFIGVGVKSAGLPGFILSAPNPDCAGCVACRDSRVAN